MSTSGTSATGISGNSSGGTESPRDWQLLKLAFTGNSPDELFAFNNAYIINYFVVQTTVDGKPANDTKAMNSSALALFRCGHVQDIEVCYDNHLCLRASCLPEMRERSRVQTPFDLRFQVFQYTLARVWVFRSHLQAASILVPCLMLLKNSAV